jgi:hypothetical protein
MDSLAQNPITPPNTICSDSEPQKMLLESSIRFFAIAYCEDEGSDSTSNFCRVGSIIK